MLMLNEFRDDQTTGQIEVKWFLCASPRGQGRFLCTALFSNGLLQLWHAFLETMFRRLNCVLATSKQIERGPGEYAVSSPLDAMLSESIWDS